MPSLNLQHSLSVIFQQKAIAAINFTKDPKGWELINSNGACASIDHDGYHLLNSTEKSWQFYHLPFQIGRGDNFLVSCSFVPEKEGKFGLVWGFNEEADTLNRFTVSLSSAYFKIAHFSRKNFIAIHQFRGKHKQIIKEKGLNNLHILKLDDHYFFYINDETKPVYQCPSMHFPILGNRVGFYLEPGAVITVKKLLINQLFSKPVNELDLKPLLAENAMNT